MKLHILLNLYNDRMFLPACLESVKDIADSIIIADGAYQRFYDNHLKLNPQAQPHSTDGGVEFVSAMHDLPTTRILRCPNGKPWINQCEKRTAMLDAVPVDDWLIIIDADEMLKGDIKEGLQAIYESGCISGRVPLYNVGLATARLKPFWHPRVFQKMKGMQYLGKHWFLRDYAGRIIATEYPVKWTDKFVFVHFKALKPVDRLTSQSSYYRGLSKQGWLEPIPDWSE